MQRLKVLTLQSLADQRFLELLPNPCGHIFIVQTFYFLSNADMFLKLPLQWNRYSNTFSLLTVCTLSVSRDKTFPSELYYRHNYHIYYHYLKTFYSTYTWRSWVKLALQNFLYLYKTFTGLGSYQFEKPALVPSPWVSNVETGLYLDWWC